MVQSREELEQFHSIADPWGYDGNEHDKRRKAMLLSEIPRRTYRSVIDIGCGHGFVTKDLPGDRILGIDIAEQAVRHAQPQATPRLKFVQGAIFDLTKVLEREGLSEGNDLMVITEVLYPQYIGEAHAVVYDIIDRALAPGGILISVHIGSWYKARFPYLLLKNIFYDYREYTHSLEVYAK
jgi:SAM-dependent methyltransferase